MSRCPANMTVPLVTAEQKTLSDEATYLVRTFGSIAHQPSDTVRPVLVILAQHALSKSLRVILEKMLEVVCDAHRSGLRQTTISDCLSEGILEETERESENER